MNGDYTAEQLKLALQQLELQPGDIVFSHIGLGLLGVPAGVTRTLSVYSLCFEAFKNVLGNQGTWIVPTYSYSLCQNEIYSPNTTPSKVGQFTEWFRKQPGVIRSGDPIFSVAGWGNNAGEIFRDIPKDCFGMGSVYSRLIEMNAKLVNIGVGVRYATIVHHIEQRLGISYRYLKRFHGKVVVGNREEEQSWNYFVRDLDFEPDLTEFESDAEQLGFVRRVQVGRGEVTAINCRDIFSICQKGFQRNPYYLAKSVEGK